MRRLEADRFGAPAEVLRVMDVAEPELSAGQVRLACDTVGLNFLDVMLCRGDYPRQGPPPVTPGVEVVGEVVEAASGATLAVGTRVLACPAMPVGALGDQVVLDAGLAVPLPDGADPVLAAALPVNYQTAWFSLRRAGLQPDETVLIHAGAGGVGVAATQLARAAGARVIAVAGGAYKTDVCRDQGADVVVDHHTEDFVQVVAEVTGGRGADVVVDPVGGDTFSRSLGCLAFEGRIIAVGAAGGNPPAVDPMALTAANVSLIGLSWGSAYPWLRPDDVREAYESLFSMLGDAVQPLVDRVVTLDQAPIALTDLANRRTVGKVVVRL